MVFLDIELDENFEMIIDEEPISPESKISDLNIFESSKSSILKCQFIPLDNSLIEDCEVNFNNTVYLNDIKIYLEIKFNIIIKEIEFNGIRYINNYSINLIDILKENNIIKIYYINFIQDLNDSINTESELDQNISENIVIDSIINFQDEIANIIDTTDTEININVLRESLESRNYTINLDEDDFSLFDDLFENYSIENKKKVTKKELKNFEISKYQDRKDVINSEFCTICYDKFEDDNLIRVLKCKHYFHNKCIEKWLIECENTCPICKKIY